MLKTQNITFCNKITFCKYAFKHLTFIMMDTPSGMQIVVNASTFSRNNKIVLIATAAS